MRARYAVWGVVLAGLMPVVSACQTLPSGRATVTLEAPETRAAVISVLARAVHRAHIELGPSDGATGTLTVLPPPLGPQEMNSPAMPIRFEIELKAGRCRAVRQDTREAFDLPGVKCTQPDR